MRMCFVVCATVVVTSGLAADSKFVEPVLTPSISSLRAYEAAYSAFVQYSVGSLTPGFREVSVTYAGNGKRVDPIVYYRFTKGPAIQSGRSLDVLLDSNGFFTVAAPWGIGYTRDGRFEKDADGRLVTVAGHYPVLGEGGEIFLGDGVVAFTSKGTIVIDNTVVDTLEIADIQNLQDLKSVNGSLFYFADGVTPKLGTSPVAVRQGVYEGANVQDTAFRDLSIFRNSYSANTKTIKMILKSYGSGIQMGSTQ